MAHLIEYFMWGYQAHFQISATVLAERLFDLLDPKLRPYVFLLGFLQEQNQGKHPICIEPEDELFHPHQFGQVGSIAERISASDPENQIEHPHPHMQEQHERGIVVRSMQKAIREELRADPGHAEFRFFVSTPGLVEGYEVYVVLMLRRAAVDRYHSLQLEKRDRYYVATSLISAAATEYLEVCATGLDKKSPGEDRSVSKRGPEDILREAGKRLMATPGCAADSIEGIHRLFGYCNTISSLPYEGAHGIGSMIVAEQGHPATTSLMEFEKPVALRQYRSARKLLEMSTETLSLVSDASKVYALGTVNESYQCEQEDLFVIRFSGHYRWELRHCDRILMTTQYGVPQLPKQMIDPDTFKSKAFRIFADASAEEIDNLWDLARTAAKQKHGTMLVVTAAARAESERLSGQNTRVSPVRLTVDLLRSISSIDGAILLDPQGVCYSIGVILDGLATPRGDSGRGARFNSAIRYVESSNAQCLAIVVSEDGTIDLVPHLKPQIPRRYVDELLQALREISESKEVNFKWYNRILNQIYEIKFYLSLQMCQEVNFLRKLIERKIREEDGHQKIQFVREDLAPTPEMNESYFLPAKAERSSGAMEGT